MKTLRGKLLTAGMISLLLLASTTIFAQRGSGFKHGQRGEGMHAGECRIPNLSEEQHEQIGTLKTAHLPEMEEHKTDMRILQEELKDLTSGTDYDVKAANKKIEEISALKEKIMKARLSHRDEVRNLLTDEQKVFFDNHRPGKGQRVGKRHGRRMHKEKGYHNCPNGK